MRFKGVRGRGSEVPGCSFWSVNVVKLRTRYSVISFDVIRLWYVPPGWKRCKCSLGLLVLLTNSKPHFLTHKRKSIASPLSGFTTNSAAPGVMDFTDSAVTFKYH